MLRLDSKAHVEIEKPLELYKDGKDKEAIISKPEKLKSPEL